MNKKLFILSITSYVFFKLSGLLHKKNIDHYDNPSSILFVRLDKLGDMCISVPYLKFLKKKYPEVELSVLCIGSNAKFLSDFQNYFNVKLYDKLIVWEPPWRKDKYRMFGLIDFVSLIKQVVKMRHNHYGVVAQPVLMGIETLFSLLIKSDYVFSCIDADMPLSQRLVKHLDFSLERHGNRDFHLSDNLYKIVKNFDSFRGVDIDGDILGTHRDLKNDCYRGELEIVINLSAGNTRRNLPYEHVCYILNHLFTNYSDEISVSLIGTEDGEELSNKLCAEFRFVDNLVGKTSFKDLFILFEATHLLITPDTGTMHLGSLLNVFMICVFGPGLVPFCKPVSKNCVIVKKELGCSGCMDFCFTSKIPPPCIEAIDPKVITLEIDQYMKRIEIGERPVEVS